MPQYNGPMYSQGPTAVGPYNLQGYQPAFGYNPQQTYMPQTPQPAPSQEPMAIPHLKTDVETMWRDATPEQRKRIKESLTKWSTTLTV